MSGLTGRGIAAAPRLSRRGFLQGVLASFALASGLATTRVAIEHRDDFVEIVMRKLRSTQEDLEIQWNAAGYFRIS